FRTAAGAEIDVVVQRGRRRLGFEIKFSSAPKPARGFWNAVEALELDHAWVVAPVRESFPLAEAVDVISPLALAAVLDARM
ncbi:MAG: DUF4143 domain-containing protein, partial [Burkholderiales bacterium]|nr:DUF4143 domain-containing protein [Burkholderiales bacterium]